MAYTTSIDPEEWTNPVILILGGSTSDPLMFGHSWPESLAAAMQERGLVGTVVTGGVGGYSTSQGLLKLLRDGLQLEPDIVITYDGVNDAGSWAVEGYPMVHPYQRSTLEALVNASRGAPSKIFPNLTFATARLRNMTRSELSGVSYGLPSTLQPGENWARNLSLMAALCAPRRIDFMAILQPVVGVGSYAPKGEVQNRYRSRPEGYGRALRDAYSVPMSQLTQLTYLFSMVEALSGIDNVFEPDGRHLTELGDSVVASVVLDELIRRNWVVQ